MHMHYKAHVCHRVLYSTPYVAGLLLGALTARAEAQVQLGQTRPACWKRAAQKTSASCPMVLESVVWHPGESRVIT